MTASATHPPSPTSGHHIPTDSFTVAADGSYAARLSTHPASGVWFPERWTLTGPEPYAVPLPVEQPEDAGSQVLPLADGRVLIARRAGTGWRLSLLYPSLNPSRDPERPSGRSGPDTGEVPLGSVECRLLRLLPPAPCGFRAFALVPDEDERSATVWLVAGSASGVPQPVARVRGRCSGGCWLDREGRLLALDRAGADGGPVKTVVVDLGAGGEVSPLLQIGEDSNDRLLMADPDSGLLLVRSDAPGGDRLGWGVLGSHRPVRFPEALRPAATRLTPIAVQPGQTLLPERCAVAFRVDAPGEHTWLAVWRPGLRELRHVAGPPGWLTGKALWTADGELQVPCSTAHTACSLARMRAPLPDEEDLTPAPAAPPGSASVGSASVGSAGPAPHRVRPGVPGPGGPTPGTEGPEGPRGAGSPGSPGSPGNPWLPQLSAAVPDSPSGLSALSDLSGRSGLSSLPDHAGLSGLPDLPDLRGLSGAFAGGRPGAFSGDFPGALPGDFPAARLPDGGAGYGGPPDGRDVTAAQHHGHGAAPSGSRASGTVAAAAPAATGPLPGVPGATPKPVPLQQAPLAGGTV